MNKETQANPPSAGATGSDALIAWLQNEVLEDEGAMINARDHAEWDRYHRLEGHKMALINVIHHIRAERQNTKLTCANPDK